MSKLTPYITLILFLGICLVSCAAEPLRAPCDAMVLAKTKINTW
ncbi:hypothetical protein [Rickettsiella endosymbiont of Dermanyssus gallinae]|nr:hypothetical protein [Rickettsiella endosymbiont of Dermanyssus gallinae]